MTLSHKSHIFLGNWAWGIGHGELGIGNWELAIRLKSVDKFFQLRSS